MVFVCAWNVCLVLCVVLWCAVSSCVRVGAGVQCPKRTRLRVYCQNARTCSICGRFASAHGDILNVHTEGFFSLSPSLSLLSLSLSFSSFLLSFFLFLLLLLFPWSPRNNNFPVIFTLLTNSTPGNKTQFRTFSLYSKSFPRKKQSGNYCQIKK